MPPRRRPARDPETPEGFIRTEDVQRFVQEAFAAERVRQAAGQDQTRAPDQAPVVVQPQLAEVPVGDLEYERYSKCLARFQKMRPPTVQW